MEILTTLTIAATPICRMQGLSPGFTLVWLPEAKALTFTEELQANRAILGPKKIHKGTRSRYSAPELQGREARGEWHHRDAARKPQLWDTPQMTSGFLLHINCKERERSRPLACGRPSPQLLAMTLAYSQWLWALGE